MASGSWTYYFGNQVAYGSGGWFRAIVGVWDGGSNTGTTTPVQYRYSVQFGTSISDSSNSVSWTDPWGSGSANNTSFVFGSGGGEKVVGGPWSQNHTIQYGGGNTAHFTMSVSGLAGAAGTSSVDVSYPLPPRSPSIPGAPQVSANLITATTARAYTTVAAAENGSTVDLVNYSLRRASDGVLVESKTGPYTGVTFGGLTRATGYSVSAQAHNGVGWGPYGSAHAFTTLPLPPTIASGYLASSLTLNSASIGGFSVTDNGGQAPSNVRVQRNTSATEAGATTVTAGGWTDVSLTGLAAATTYHYRAAAYNSAGWGSYGPWKSFTTLSDAPNDMAAPTFSSVTNTSFRASWVAPAMNGATFVNYKYDVSTSSTFASVVATGTTTALFVDVTGLTPGTRYYVRVRANATPNNGGYGTADQLTTGVAPLSGMRVYSFIDGVRKQGELYTFLGGVRYKVLPMWQHDGTMETE